VRLCALLLVVLRLSLGLCLRHISSLLGLGAFGLGALGLGTLGLGLGAGDWLSVLGVVSLSRFGFVIENLIPLEPNLNIFFDAPSASKSSGFRLRGGFGGIMEVRLCFLFSTSSAVQRPYPALPRVSRKRGARTKTAFFPVLSLLTTAQFAARVGSRLLLNTLLETLPRATVSSVPCSVFDSASLHSAYPLLG